MIRQTHNTKPSHRSAVPCAAGGSPLFVGMASRWHHANPAMGALGRDRQLVVLNVETCGTILRRTA